MTAENKKVKLTANLAAAEGLVADRRALKQILLNLLSNAIKFTPAGGTVEVATASKAGWFWLGVADDGEGISEEDLQRLGRPFEQASTAYTREREGTGLGLCCALVRRDAWRAAGDRERAGAGDHRPGLPADDPPGPRGLG